MCKLYLRKFTPLSENSYVNLTPTLMCNPRKIQGRRSVEYRNQAVQERSCFWKRGSGSLRIRDNVGCWGRQDFQINIPSHHPLIHRAHSAAESQGFLQIIKYLAYHLYEIWCSYLVAPRRVFLSKTAQCVFSLPANTVNDEEMTKFSIVTTFYPAWEVQVSWSI